MSFFTPDYNETNPNAVDYIKNKPTSFPMSFITGLISALAGKFANPSGTTGQYIKGDGSLGTFPTIPAAQVQSDFAQTNNASVDYIKNKQIAKTWSGTTTSGTSTIYLTNNGLSGGTAFYTSIESIMVAFTGNDTNLGKTYTISGDLKTLTVTCTQQTFNGVTLIGIPVLGSITLGAVPNGTALKVLINGIPA